MATEGTENMKQKDKGNGNEGATNEAPKDSPAVQRARQLVLDAERELSKRKGALAALISMESIPLEARSEALTIMRGVEGSTNVDARPELVGDGKKGGKKGGSGGGRDVTNLRDDILAVLKTPSDSDQLRTKLIDQKGYKAEDIIRRIGPMLAVLKRTKYIKQDGRSGLWHVKK